MELTAPVFVAQVWEPPHISKANDLSCDSQEELNFARPLSSAVGAGCRVGFANVQLEAIHRAAMTRVFWPGELMDFYVALV